MKRKPVALGKVTSAADMFEKVIEKGEKRLKAFEAAGDGLCMKCKKNPADEFSHIDPLSCSKCNGEIEDLLKKLRGPGFMEMRIGRK